MTNALLTYLCREIESGRPVAALLRAAEYLSADSPVWKALAKKAQAHLTAPTYAGAQEVLAKILTGATLSALSEAEQLSLTEICEQAHTQRRSYVVPEMPLRQRIRHSVRVRVRG